MAHGVTINPVAFLVINKDQIKLMPINHASTLDKIVDYVPDILSKFCDCKKEKESENEEEDDKKEETVKTTTIKTETVKSDNEDYLEDE